MLRSRSSRSRRLRSLAAAALVWLGCRDFRGPIGTGEGEPACRISPTDLDFGTVFTGVAAETSFTLRNVGEGTLTGRVGVADSTGTFAITSGGGFFSLGPGQVRRVVMRFEPGSAESSSAEVRIGTLCRSIACRGIGKLSARCSLEPDSLDFGFVLVGESAERFFTLANTGGDTLRGDIPASCGSFSVVLGSGPFSLLAGDSLQVKVRFEPASTGTSSCDLAIGSARCARVSCRGLSDRAPVCDVAPTQLDFGTVLIGSFSERVLSITNTGGGRVAGRLEAACADYSFSPTPGDYDLTAGQSANFTVRFQPTSSGPAQCTLSTGNALCDEVQCRAEGQLPADCVVAPSQLDFGTVTIGTSADRSFTVRNVGGAALDGSIAAACTDFSIVSGAGPFHLEAADSVTVTMRFAPSGTGERSCTVATGTALCRDVPCRGAGEEPPQCQLSATQLDFGTVLVGGSDDRSFTITNIGGGRLNGDVSIPCADYAILVGGGAFSLGASESRDVTVRFRPTTFGNLDCGLDLGGACQAVACSGTGGVSFSSHVRAAVQGSCTGCHPRIAPGDFLQHADAFRVVDVANPASSSLLRKPAGQVVHGGVRIANWGVGESLYTTVLHWIQQGALDN